MTIVVNAVTQEAAGRARLSGACHVPEVGVPLSELSQSDLIWAENHGIKTADGQPPIWLFAKTGSGDGYGYGDGSGDGYGYGDGDGSGYGSAYGSDSGYGSGYGSGGE